MFKVWLKGVAEPLEFKGDYEYEIDTEEGSLSFRTEDKGLSDYIFNWDSVVWFEVKP